MYVIVQGHFVDNKVFVINSNNSPTYDSKQQAEEEAKKWAKLHHKQYFVLSLLEMLDVEENVVKQKIK